MANKIFFEDDTQNGNIIEIDVYEDQIGSGSVKFIIDLKSDKKKYHLVNLSRSDVQQMMKWFIDILG